MGSTVGFYVRELGSRQRKPVFGVCGAHETLSKLKKLSRFGVSGFGANTGCRTKHDRSNELPFDESFRMRAICSGSFL